MPVIHYPKAPATNDAGGEFLERELRGVVIGKGGQEKVFAEIPFEEGEYTIDAEEGDKVQVEIINRFVGGSVEQCSLQFTAGEKIEHENGMSVDADTTRAVTQPGTSAETSDVAGMNADDAIEAVGRMTSKDKLQRIATNDSRSTVREAARKRLESLGG